LIKVTEQFQQTAPDGKARRGFESNGRIELEN
jgi:hypothetical protein